MKYICILLASVCSGAFISFSQSEVDVYRFSNTTVSGSARFDALSGSFGALGAESGCVRINPAGFGRYSKSTFSTGLNQTTVKTKAHFQGVITEQKESYFRMPNFSGVIVKDISANRSGFIYSQIGFGLNRVADFNNSFNYKGVQFESLLDVFCQDGFGIDPIDLAVLTPYTTSLAYETYAIDYDNSATYYPRLTNGDLFHERSVKTAGGINEWYLNFSGNYLNRLYIGASISVQSLNYSEAINHKETLLDTVGVSLRSFDYDYSFTTKGSGTNAKIGFIYLPTTQTRVGFSLHLPTFFNLTDVTTANMTALHKDGVKTVPPSLVPNYTYKYRLWTPTKLVGSFAYVFGVKGCINIDLEYMNYAWGKLLSTTDSQYEPYSFTVENNSVKQRLKAVINVRVGGEFVIKNKLFLRGGYAVYPKGDVSLTYGSKFTQQISGGLGYRFGKLTVDFALKQLTQQKNYVSFFNSVANVDYKVTTAVLGIQYKFKN